MSKVVHVAVREFLATVLTKGFLIGILLTPAIIAVMALVFPLLLSRDAPRVEGELAVVDPTGQVSAGVRTYLAPEAMAARRDDLRRDLEQQAAQMAAGRTQDTEVLDAVLGDIPDIAVVELPADADLDAAKAALVDGTVNAGGRLAVAVIHADAVVSQDGDLGTYDLYIREKLDDRIEEEITAALRRALVDARLDAAGLDPDQVGVLTRVARVRSRTVTAEGEQETNLVLNMLLPAGFMILLMLSSLVSGQHLMTNTIEEKSSRVVEVLLSAVSPMALMAGKIIGQLCVGLLILGMYSAMGMSALLAYAAMGLIELRMLFFLFVFFLIAYLILGSLMAAIGAAVNELREAQSLMTPLTLLIMVPWLLWMPISRDPNSVFAVITSFIPPINAFVMLLRMTSSAPPPGWQVWASIGVGVVGIFAALWLAAKVFRIGLLMHGKPPDFATLLRWLRMA